MYIILRTDYYIYINGTIISLFLPNKYCSYIDVNFNCKIPSINDDLHTIDPRFVFSLQIRVLSRYCKIISAAKTKSILSLFLYMVTKSCPLNDFKYNKQTRFTTVQDNTNVKV